jgi:hypothetical protein|tara:strand:+ start:948 stop:1190 length:243 start_codon:yes stop_codon:yes gene_type:complete
LTDSKAIFSKDIPIHTGLTGGNTIILEGDLLDDTANSVKEDDQIENIKIIFPNKAVQSHIALAPLEGISRNEPESGFLES